MLKNTPVVPAFNPLPPKACWGVLKTYAMLDKYFTPDTFPEALLSSKAQDQDLALMAFGMTMSFLEEALISDQALTTG